MKKTLLTLAVLCMCHAVFSQEAEKVKKEPLNEIRLNLATTVFALYPEINYERSLTEELGLGIAAAVSLNGKSFDELYNFQLTPFFRFYFGRKPFKLFFIEANAALVNFRNYYYESVYSGRNKTITEFGLGLAIGYKFFNRSNFTGEIYTGVGRTLGDYFYPRIGISIGKLF